MDRGNVNVEDANVDELIDSLETDEEFMSNYREKRLQEISDGFKSAQKNVAAGYGTVNTITGESELMRLVTATEKIVVHFYLENFEKCTIMDKKLDEIACRNLSTRFVRINVTQCPFLVKKLDIKVLPLLIAYDRGVKKDQLIGFSKLGNNPSDFEAELLEERLRACGITPKSENTLRFSTRGSKGRGILFEEDD
ncbi:LAMI_0H18426g1_1 [Lachancea mirantina]|uniref:LAMI_0H18426g1_1 n=1 Tax=Lachancea mirantina TaxID=1230905 RepID=A0A1G4KJR3_9SACH|nr:LAMI_0H18426g1_1 [Lachancea mirantina]